MQAVSAKHFSPGIGLYWLLQAVPYSFAKESVKHGVYSCCSGPSYETIAEQRLAAIVGVDALGMSTTYEGELTNSL